MMGKLTECACSWEEHPTAGKVVTNPCVGHSIWMQELRREAVDEVWKRITDGDLSSKEMEIIMRRSAQISEELRKYIENR